MRNAILTAGLIALTATPALSEIVIKDAYARAASPAAKAGAAFMVIENTGDTDDRLADARSDIAMKVELHTHKADDAGVMQMLHVPEGFVIPAHGSHALARGGDHVMFMGLKGPMVDGETVPVTLVFDDAGEVTLEIPVDLNRKAGAMEHGHMDHGEMDHGDMDHSGHDMDTSGN